MGVRLSEGNAAFRRVGFGERLRKIRRGFDLEGQALGVYCGFIFFALRWSQPPPEAKVTGRAVVEKSSTYVRDQEGENVD